jgi:hypothetical protein
VGAPMNARRHARLAFLLAGLALSLALVPSGALGAGPSATSSTPPFVGNITGPSYLAEQANATYELNASGGPAVVDGSLVGGINFTTALSGPNLNGITATPVNGSITALGTPVPITVKASNISETITLQVHLLSTLGRANETLNLTYTIQIKTPYIVSAVVRAGATPVLPFTVAVFLDGARVGNVTVPILVAYQAYQIVFRYGSPGLPSGYHTFTLSVLAEHGLVTFANGLSSFSTTFYVAPPPANYSVWYVAGVVAFFGALFIFATRVAARRRGPGRR